ncbi:hypothetical protein [Syntrophotalea acetylenica]|uniref:Uncharacterized protein n=1 Tax=Syntrophotalea acetylenica TaxID=29542 RepID=A0A1L3GDH0_SYNAC|nr:hypothetical protein [Syntrophotalea acetylenica]APG24001.1 hypothetical protein A7E75_02415 [Syntrophotalea acetylenica]APG44584.1 hypothetical protein A6070_11035 [Syntrophotalea acetylenica]
MQGTPIKLAAQLVELPKAVLSRLHRDGVITDPVSDDDLRGLVLLGHVWGKPWYARRMLAPLSKDYRRKLLLEPDLSRAERYALSCYLNAKKGTRVYTRDIIGRVRHYLGANLSEEQVKKVRTIAYDIRRGKRLDFREAKE